MRALLAIAAVLLNGAAPVAAAAPQAQPGHADYPAQYSPLAEQSRQFAHCILGRARKASIRLVKHGLPEDEAKATVADIKQAMGGCNNNRPSLTLNVYDLRGDLAEQLLLEDHNALLQQAAQKLPVPPMRIAFAAKNLTDPIFDCTVGADPADAVKMIEAVPATPGEATSFRAMVPSLQACVPMEYALHMKPHLVRRHVAEALYRLAAAGTGA